MPVVEEDTVDLGVRPDPTRTLLRRTAAADQRAASALVDVLGPRIHGLAVHITGSSAAGSRVTVSVLRSSLRDAAELAAGALPGEAAVLDRARRAAVATRPRGDVRSLIAPDGAEERTRDRREMDVMRALLELPPAQRALAESAAQGRFEVSGAERDDAAGILAHLLDQLVPFGGAGSSELRALAALDALALAEEPERRRLRDLTTDPESAGIHRRAIEAAASLTLLTAAEPSQGLHRAVLEGFGSAPRPAAGAGSDPEAAYHGTYTTPVLGTDSQRRAVGPPAVPGAVRSTATASSPAPGADAPRADRDPDPAPAPAFAFRRADEVRGSRRGRRRENARAGQAVAGSRSRPWVPRSVAALALIAALVLGAFLIDARREQALTEAFASTWTQYSLDPGAQLVSGRSDNGDWAAVIATDGLAVRAEGVRGYEGEVLQLWGTTDGVQEDLGVLEISGDGLIRFTSPRTAESLVVTREMAPQNVSGTPSTRIVASLAPELPAPDASG
ncbi:hypothetical protein [Brachybacterium sp. P6-10-X1]|uniref:hypothetical protein n=1 Tax=Brachybacterium sp. P6-10-X1 TaxID=1903186 RepID=UPI0012FBA087|nr:hypothetical protein [Brachybacterium sp. P6-10-X1]